MIIDRILLSHTPTLDSISHTREMLLDYCFPRYIDMEVSKLVKEAGEYLSNMVYLHSILHLEVNPNFEIWLMAEWLSINRYLYYTEVSSRCKETLASFLGTAIYDYIRTKPCSLDRKTLETLERLFRDVEWQLG